MLKLKVLPIEYDDKIEQECQDIASAMPITTISNVAPKTSIINEDDSEIPEVKMQEMPKLEIQEIQKIPEEEIQETQKKIPKQEIQKIPEEEIDNSEMQEIPKQEISEQKIQEILKILEEILETILEEEIDESKIRELIRQERLKQELLKYKKLRKQVMLKQEIREISKLEIKPMTEVEIYDMLESEKRESEIEETEENPQVVNNLDVERPEFRQNYPRSFKPCQLCSDQSTEDLVWLCPFHKEDIFHRTCFINQMKRSHNKGLEYIKDLENLTCQKCPKKNYRYNSSTLQPPHTLQSPEDLTRNYNSNVIKIWMICLGVFLISVGIVINLARNNIM